jgi:hypothetical protein
VLHLDSDLLDRNFHQIIYHGMILNIWTLVVAPFSFALLVTIHSGYVLEISYQLNKGFKAARKIVAIKKWLKLPTKKKKTIEKKYYARISMAWTIFFVSFVFMFSMVLFEKKGKNEANTLLENIKKDSYGLIKIQGSDTGLAFLYCGSRNCAGLNLESEEIIYFPQNGHSFLSKKYNNRVNSDG